MSSHARRQEGGSMKRPRVVIVDDNEDLAHEMGEMMNLNGYDVRTVSDPSIAVHVIEEFSPDVVLLDLKMRGTDGFAVADALSHDAETVGIPVVAMTGCYGDEERERLKECGVVKGFLTKPFAVSELIVKVNEVRRLR
jgi:DNA-binding response OmpR family regulator